jgi:hypothetical protein
MKIIALQMYIYILKNVTKVVKIIKDVDLKSRVVHYSVHGHLSCIQLVHFLGKGHVSEIQIVCYSDQRHLSDVQSIQVHGLNARHIWL